MAATAAISSPSRLLFPSAVLRRSSSIKMKAEEGEASGGYKKVFVAGAGGRTGRRVVEQLLAKGFDVRAGALDVARARGALPSSPNLEIVRADVTEGPDKLADAIGDADAVICATGFRYSWDVFAPWKVDNWGTVNLVEACRRRTVGRFVLVSSILVNGAAWGQLLNPAYVVLNAVGLTLVAKLQAEKFIRKSGINYTIVRPGGLREDPPSGNLVMTPEDTLYKGSISREQVAEVAAGALLCPESSFKVVEIVSDGDAPARPLAELFASVPQR
ncbi:NAD(P)-binding Rossmann-fold superfamily protein [Wolffia australiana]